MIFMQTHSGSTQHGANPLNKTLNWFSRCRWVTVSQLYRLWFRSLSALGGYFCTLQSFGDTYCLYLRGWKCVSSMVNSIRSTWFVHYNIIVGGRSSHRRVRYWKLHCSFRTDISLMSSENSNSLNFHTLCTFRKNTFVGRRVSVHGGWGKVMQCCTLTNETCKIFLLQISTEQ